MNEKKKRILEESVKLFAKKGYYSTSIQEIVNQSQVSKGAFYLYFSSKEALVLEIIEYYHALVLEKVNAIRSENIDPRIKLQSQVQMIIDLVSEHREYVLMTVRDKINIEEIDQLMYRVNKSNFNWIKMSIEEVYGKEIERYSVDATILLDGLVQGYLKSIVLFDLDLDNTCLAQFIIQRFDDMVKGLLRQNVNPQVNLIDINRKQLETTDDQNIYEDYLKQIIATVNQLKIPNQQKQQLNEAVSIIEQEWKKEETNLVIIRGMLAELSTVEQLKELTHKLGDFMGIKLNS